MTWSCSSLASPDTETAPNTLVLVGHNLQGVLARLDEMKISKSSTPFVFQSQSRKGLAPTTLRKSDDHLNLLAFHFSTTLFCAYILTPNLFIAELPHNILTIDTMVYERALYANGQRGVMQDPTKGPDKARINGSSLSFENLLFSLTLPGANNATPVSSGTGSSGDKEKDKSPSQTQTLAPLVLPQYAPHNSGNDAIMCLFALQRLLEPAGTPVPTVKKVGKSSKAAVAAMIMGVPMVPMAPMPMAGMPMSMPMMGMNNMSMSLGVPGAMAMGIGNGMGVPFPQGASRSQAKSRPTTVYDLASEFGQMQMQLSASGGAGASRVPNLGSYGYSSTSLRPPLGAGSKRMHSFPNPKTEALE